MWCLASLAFSAIALVTWSAQALFRRDTTFATVSNVAFAADIVLIPALSRRYLVDTHPMLYATSVISALLGAASFAFHQNPTLGTPAHALDISMGWLMYMHLALLAAFTLVQRFVAWPRLLLATTLVESAGIFAIFSLYDTIKPQQKILLIACGGVAFGGTLLSRLVVAGCGAVRPAVEAVLDFATLVLLQVVATTVQGQIWYRSVSDERYNVEHGYWHLLNGTIVGVVVMQTVHNLRGMPVRTTCADHACRVGLVCVALGLLAATLGNPSDRLSGATTFVLVAAHLGLGCASGLALWRSGRTAA